MEDLAGKIADILGNPEIMNQLKGLSGLKDTPDPRASEKNEEKKQEKEPEGFEFSDDMLQIMMKLMPLLSSLNLKQDDKYTCFLTALKPLLSKPRREKLESSKQILQIIRILPLLKNQGIL